MEAKLREQVKTAALLAAILGPALFIFALTGVGLGLLVAFVRADPELEMLPLSPPLEFCLGFAERSALVSIPLGLWLFAAGLFTLRDRARGRPWLSACGWGSVLGLLGLGGIWSWEVERAGLSFGFHILGGALHLAQAVVVARVAAFLSSAPVLAACEDQGRLRDSPR